MRQSHPQARSRTAVIVLGMHRSGTSALAGVLSLLGISSPRSLMVPTPDNPKGYWESTALMTVHERIFKSGGSSWHDWDRFNPGWMASPDAGLYADQLESAIRSEFGEAPTLLVKDPRICRLMPLWRHVLDRMGIDARVVMPIRRPSEVSQSLLARNGFGAMQGQALWLRHVLEAELGSRGMTRSLVTYDDLMRDWRGAVGRVGRELGLAWPRWSGQVEAEIDAYLSEDLRHNRSDEAIVRSTGQPLDEWVMEAYAALSEASMADAPDLQPRLDRIRSRFDESCRAYMPVIHEIQSRLEADKKTLKTALEKTRLESEALSAGQAQSERLAAELTARVDAVARERDALQLAQEAMGVAQASQLQAAVLGHAEAMEAASSAHAEAMEAAGNAHAEAMRALRLAHSGEAEALASAHRQQVESLERTLAEERSRNAAMQEELDSACRRLAAVEGDLEASEHRYQAEVDVQRTTQAQEAQRQQSMLDTANASIQERFAETQLLTGMVFSLEDAIAGQESRMEELERARVEAARRADVESRALKQAIEMQRATIERLNHWGNAVLAGRTLKTARMLSGAPRAMSVPDLSGQAGVPDRQLLLRSRYFNPDWYLQRYPDVAGRKMDAAMHYLKYGAREGRDPGPAFSTRGYLKRYPDVVDSGMNPLVHYLRHGMQEGRATHGDTTEVRT